MNPLMIGIIVALFISACAVPQQQVVVPCGTNETFISNSSLIYNNGSKVTVVESPVEACKAPSG